MKVLTVLGKIFSILVVTIVILLISSIIIGPLFPEFDPGMVIIGALFVSTFTFFATKKIKKGWSRSVLLMAVIVFMIPIAGLIYSGIEIDSAVTKSEQSQKAFYYTEQDLENDVEIAGSMIAGVAIGGITSIFAFFFGVILLLISMALGKEPVEVIVVNQVNSND